MTSEPLDELYFKWLYSLVADPGQDLTYWKLLKVLYTTEFVWVVPNDENRISDARALRAKFVDTQGIRLRRSERDWIDLGCSILEVMVGLAYRLEFEAYTGRAHYWFWVLLDNIGLSEFDDSCEIPEGDIRDVLEMVIQRYYEPDGRGGFFPLDHPDKDQRQVELWGQVSSYVLERGLAG